MFVNNGTLATPMTGTVLQAVNVFSSSQATGGSIVGTISGNHISNGVSASGIAVVIQGQTSATLLIDNNRIRNTPDARGISVAFRGPANPLAATLGPNTIVSNLTLTNNDVDPGVAPSGFPLAAIMVEADNQSGADDKSPTVRADIRGNTVPAGAAFDLLPTYLAYFEDPTVQGLTELANWSVRVPMPPPNSRAPTPAARRRSGFCSSPVRSSRRRSGLAPASRMSGSELGATGCQTVNRERSGRFGPARRADTPPLRTPRFP